MSKSKSLIDFWHSKLESVNAKNLTIFIFRFNGNSYISEWQKNKWQEPCRIEEIDGKE